MSILIIPVVFFWTFEWKFFGRHKHVTLYNNYLY